jgi:hypothetical protein
MKCDDLEKWLHELRLVITELLIRILELILKKINISHVRGIILLFLRLDKKRLWQMLKVRA